MNRTSFARKGFGVSAFVISVAIGSAACSQEPAVPADTAEATDAAAQTAYPAYVTAAVNDPARPAEAVADDENRKPAEMLVYAGVEPGDKVAEWIPGGGYFTRIFGKAVGSDGKVYALTSERGAGRVQTIADEETYGGVVEVVAGDLTAIAPPEPVDVVWTSRNYHDLPVATRAALNTASYNMLEPGGVYIVLDHSAVAGSGAESSSLHRIDEEVVKQEVVAAGFEFAGESDALRNPGDNRTAPVFDSDVRGDTDQFILKFQKPE
jgi:predicted methyltransferase